jgi:hypothetical protein
MIGVAKIHLKDLVTLGLVQGSYPIINRKNKMAGEISVNIFWEELGYTGELASDKTFENKIWEKVLVRKLADLMKHKGLTLYSAFNLFDKNNKEVIQVEDFKDLVQFHLKFTDKLRELEELVDSIFGKKRFLTKVDFYHVFSYLLPHDGPSENLLNEDLRSSKISIKRQNEDIKIDHSLEFSIGHDGKDTNKLKTRLSSKDLVKKVTFEGKEPKDKEKKEKK